MLQVQHLQTDSDVDPRLLLLKVGLTFGLYYTVCSTAIFMSSEHGQQKKSHMNSIQPAQSFETLVFVDYLAGRLDRIKGRDC